MSYRIGDQIYWTRNKVLLNAGEITLTNGDIEIRARCGNRISETAMFPASDSEPDVVEFDRLVDDEPDRLASWGFAFPAVVARIGGRRFAGRDAAGAVGHGAAHSDGPARLGRRLIPARVVWHQHQPDAGRTAAATPGW
jgi:hypothetical protein